MPDLPACQQPETLATPLPFSSGGADSAPGIRKRLLIVTDAWTPQLNGVVRTLQTTAAHLKSRGFEVHVVSPSDGPTTPCPTYPEIRLARQPRRLVREALERLKPDALHISTEGPLGWAARRIALQEGLAYTTAYHTQFPEYVKARTGIPVSWTSALLKRFHRHSSSVLVPSPTLIRVLQQRGFQRLQHWTRGVDEALFNPGAQGLRAHSPDRTPVFLYVGRVAVEKNIEAFLKLNLPGEKWVVGDGPAAAGLRAAYPDAQWKGTLTGEPLAEAYRSADVFVFPSKTDTFGLVMAEAMACGTPVAAFPVAGPLDVVEQGVSGELSEDLGAACRSALQLPREAVWRASRRFTWAAATDQFVSYLVCLKGGAPLSPPAPCGE